MVRPSCWAVQRPVRAAIALITIPAMHRTGDLLRVGAPRHPSRWGKNYFKQRPSPGLELLGLSGRTSAGTVTRSRRSYAVDYYCLIASDCITRGNPTLSDHSFRGPWLHRLVRRLEC